MVELLNERLDDQLLHHLIEKDDEVVVWESFELSGRPENQIDNITPDLELPTEPGSITIHARVGKEHTSRVLTEYDCAFVQIWIRPEDTDNDPIVIKSLDDECPG